MRYRLLLQIGDVAVAAVTGAVMLVLRPGEVVSVSPYALVAVLLPALWPLALGMTAAYRETLFGNGSEEFRRVARAGLWAVAGVAIVLYGGKL